jgi:hypothetical protein
MAQAVALQPLGLDAQFLLSNNLLTQGLGILFRLGNAQTAPADMADIPAHGVAKAAPFGERLSIKHNQFGFFVLERQGSSVNAGTAAKGIPLIDNENGTPALRQTQGRGQPGDASTENRDISLF